MDLDGWAGDSASGSLAGASARSTGHSCGVGMIAQRAPALRAAGMGGDSAQGGFWHRSRPAGANPGPLTHVAAIRREQAGAGAVVCKGGACVPSFSPSAPSWSGAGPDGGGPSKQDPPFCWPSQTHRPPGSLPSPPRPPRPLHHVSDPPPVVSPRHVKDGTCPRNVLTGTGWPLVPRPPFLQSSRLSPVPSVTLNGSSLCHGRLSRGHGVQPKWVQESRAWEGGWAGCPGAQSRAGPAVPRGPGAVSCCSW